LLTTRIHTLKQIGTKRKTHRRYSVSHHRFLPVFVDSVTNQRVYQATRTSDILKRSYYKNSK
jgi:hypothetical protein